MIGMAQAAEITIMTKESKSEFNRTLSSWYQLVLGHSAYEKTYY